MRVVHNRINCAVVCPHTVDYCAVCWDEMKKVNYSSQVLYIREQLRSRFISNENSRELEE